MPKNLRYNISIAYLESSDPGKRNQLYERVIYSFDNIDDARDKFIELTIRANRDLNESKYDFSYEIDEMKQDFSHGDDDVWYRVSFKEIHDYADSKLYIGPGAYVLKGSLLQ